MKENDIVINDLHSYAMLKVRNIQLPGQDVHFTEEGYEYLAKKVVSVCDTVLKKKLEMEIENNDR